jgi:hypothetical protein
MILPHSMNSSVISVSKEYFLFIYWLVTCCSFNQSIDVFKKSAWSTNTVSLQITRTHLTELDWLWSLSMATLCYHWSRMARRQWDKSFIYCTCFVWLVAAPRSLAARFGDCSSPGVSLPISPVTRRYQMVSAPNPPTWDSGTHCKSSLGYIVLHKIDAHACL